MRKRLEWRGRSGHIPPRPAPRRQACAAPARTARRGDLGGVRQENVRMRRLAFTSVLLGALAGCSGLGKFADDTFTLPGANPNIPHGSSETIKRVEARPIVSGGLVPESGNVWPGEPKPFPTLGEVERETENGSSVPAYNTGTGGGSTGGPGLGRSGGGQASSGAGAFKMQPNVNAPSTITIPNGNGTSTVIAPDGSVKVIPTPGAPAGPATTAAPAAPASGK